MELKSFIAKCSQRYTLRKSCAPCDLVRASEITIDKQIMARDRTFYDSYNQAVCSRLRILQGA
jgi:hypothetical protein